MEIFGWKISATLLRKQFPTSKKPIYYRWALAVTLLNRGAMRKQAENFVKHFGKDYYKGA